jgi:hypothetical protein
MADVGLTIVEGVANGATAYKEPSKRNIGLLGQFVRGGAFSPVKITNLEEFNNVFGGQSASFFGPGIVKSIFDEAGNAPVTMYLARVVGSGSVVASGTGSLSGDATMTVKAGYKGKEDPGVWANGIEVSLYSYSSRVKGMFTLVVTYGGNFKTAKGMVTEPSSRYFFRTSGPISILPIRLTAAEITFPCHVNGFSDSFFTKIFSATPFVLSNSTSL